MKLNRFYHNMDRDFQIRRKTDVVVAPEPRESLPTEWPLCLSLAFLGGMLIALVTG